MNLLTVRRLSLLAVMTVAAASLQLSVVAISSAQRAVTSAPAAATAGELEPIPVMTARRRVMVGEPAADGHWFVWRRALVRFGEPFEVFAKRGSEPRVRVSPRGVRAWGGDIHRGLVVYVQDSGNDAFTPQTDLFQFDLRTDKRAPFPGVNTDQDEAEPSVTDSHVLFSRARHLDNRDVVVRILLLDRRTGRVTRLNRTVIQSNRLLGPTSEAGQVNGRYAVFQLVRGVRHADLSVTWHSRVVRYDIRTGTRLRFRWNAWVDTTAVSADGTVYLFRRHPGSGIDLVRVNLNGQRRVLTTLPERLLVSHLRVDDRSNGSKHLYYSRNDGVNNEDIFKVIDRGHRR